MTPFCFLCRYAIVVWISGGSDDGKDPLTLLDDDDDMLPDDEAIGVVVPNGFRLQESRPAARDSSFSQTWSTSESEHGVVWWPDNSPELGADEACVRLPCASRKRPKRAKYEATVRCIQHRSKRGGGCVCFAGAKRQRADGGCGRREKAGMSACSYISRRRKTGSQ